MFSLFDRIINLENFKTTLSDEFEALCGEVEERELDKLLDQRGFEDDIGRRKVLTKSLQGNWLKGIFVFFLSNFNHT